MSPRSGPTPLPIRVRRGLLVIVATMVFYYAVPVGEVPSNLGIVLSVLGVLGGMGVTVWLTVRQLRRLAASEPGDESVRIEGLLFLVYVVVPVFALGYFGLEKADPDQFAELATKTDSLYFTVSTLATVGYGDVHATGQLARLVVIIQIAFNLVFVGTLVSLLTRLIHERGSIRRAMAERAGVEPGSEPQPDQGPWRASTSTGRSSNPGSWGEVSTSSAETFCPTSNAGTPGADRRSTSTTRSDVSTSYGSGNPCCSYRVRLTPTSWCHVDGDRTSTARSGTPGSTHQP